MNTSRIIRIALLAGLVAGALPSAADAQLGGALKRRLQDKVAGAVVGTVAGPAGDAAGGSAGSRAVLEITPDVLDRLEKALAAESAERAAIAQQWGSRLSADEYWKCQQAAEESPEAQKIRERFVDEILEANGSVQKVGEVQEKLTKSLEQHTRDRCGANPTPEDAREREALASRIASAGASAGGFAMDAGAAGRGGSGSQAASREYAILKERIPPFCGGAGKTGRYSYSASEKQALEPRCPALMKALSETL